MNPLLMVHGIVSNARETFGVPTSLLKKPRPDSMYLFLQQLGYQPGQDLFWYSYQTLNPIPVSARRLQSELNRVRQLTGCEQVDLLTFSLGGIVSKYYGISPLYQNDLRKIIMIAPPFLGSRWADWFPVCLTKSATDLMFSGDGRALSPQVLSCENPFLEQLAHTPFPEDIKTSIIAMKALPGKDDNPISLYVKALTGWLGAGDLIVPVKSTKIPVNNFCEIDEEFSIKTIHKYLPYHPKVQQQVAEYLVEV